MCRARSGVDSSERDCLGHDVHISGVSLLSICVGLPREESRRFSCTVQIHVVLNVRALWEAFAQTSGSEILVFLSILLCVLVLKVSTRTNQALHAPL